VRHDARSLPASTCTGSPWSFAASSSVSVSGGCIDHPSAVEEEETLYNGVKLILLLSGSLECSSPDIARVRITGPSLCAVLNDGDHVASQAFHPRERLCYVSVCFDRETGATLFGADGGALAGGRHPGVPRLIRRPVGAALAGLGRQMLTSRLRPEAASLYMIGKGFELGGLAADALARDSADSRKLRLSTSEVERLQEARRILLASLSDAPDLATLARQVGLNIRKLTTGFDALFGATPSSFLQAARLDAAHRMIATGEWGIAQAAWRVGYTPAAFSTAFRRRFGIPPSHLLT